MGGFEYLEHASDVRIRAWGFDLDETIRQVSQALWCLVVDPDEVLPEIDFGVTVTARDREELVVNVLNEQLFLVDSKGLVAKEVLSVTTIASGLCGTADAPANELTAKVALRGCRTCSMGVPLLRYLKAATFHDLAVTDREIAITLDI